MKVEVKEKTTQVFLVGCKEFLTKEDADAYIKSVEEELNWTYFDVTFSPDLNEGRGYYNQITLATRGYCGLQVAQDYCYTNYGKAVAWVQDAQAMPNWVIHEGRKMKTIEELEQFKTEKITRGVGDYLTSERRKIVYIGARPKLGVFEIT